MTSVYFVFLFIFFSSSSLIIFPYNLGSSCRELLETTLTKDKKVVRHRSQHRLLQFLSNLDSIMSLLNCTALHRVLESVVWLNDIIIYLFVHISIQLYIVCSCPVSAHPLTIYCHATRVRVAVSRSVVSLQLLLHPRERNNCNCINDSMQC